MLPRVLLSHQVVITSQSAHEPLHDKRHWAICFSATVIVLLHLLRSIAPGDMQQSCGRLYTCATRMQSSQGAANCGSCAGVHRCALLLGGSIPFQRCLRAIKWDRHHQLPSHRPHPQRCPVGGSRRSCCAVDQQQYGQRTRARSVPPDIGRSRRCQHGRLRCGVSARARVSPRCY